MYLLSVPLFQTLVINLFKGDCFFSSHPGCQFLEKDSASFFPPHFFLMPNTEMVLTNIIDLNTFLFLDSSFCWEPPLESWFCRRCSFNFKTLKILIKEHCIYFWLHWVFVAVHGLLIASLLAADTGFRALGLLVLHSMRAQQFWCRDFLLPCMWDHPESEI